MPTDPLCIAAALENSTESEYMALTHAGEEAIWIRNFAVELGICSEHSIPLKSDNMSSISLTQRTNMHTRTKHIDIRFHWIRQAIQDNRISISHCPTHEQAADMMTKVPTNPLDSNKRPA